MADQPSGFWNWAEAEPNKLAVVDPDGTETTFGELLAESNRVAHGLRALGLQRGDSVAMVQPNGHQLLEVYLAALITGLYVTPVNWHLTGPEIAYIVDDCEAKALIVHEQFADACRKAVDEISFPSQSRFTVGTVEGFRPYAELKSDQPDTLPDDRSSGQAMFYTSGTTGKPKGVRRPLGNADPIAAAGAGAGFPRMFGVTPGDDGVELVPGPMYHTAVLVFGANGLHLGHAVVLMGKWDAEETLRLIDRYKVTWSHMVPTHFHRMLALPDEVRTKYDMSSLRSIIHAAAPCPIETKEKMLEWWGPVVWEYYAATEGGGTIVSPQDWTEHRGTVGRPWPGAEIKVVDDDGNDCAVDQPGTVYIKLGGPASFEYYKDKQKTDDSRLGDYFTVGDIGYVDADGWLFLCDRKVDMIISGGVNIYPAEVEAELIGHPKVGDVAVFGVPNSDMGEEVKAVVEPAPGVEASDELAAELMAFCRERLAGYKCPRSLEFRDKLPREANGKLMKRKIRDEYWEGQTTRI